MSPKLFLITALLATSQAHAQLWSDKATNVAMIAANTLLVMDWAQTRYIADHPEQYMEVGPAAEYIGAHPTTGAVNKHFVKSLIQMNVIGYFLPESIETFGIRWSPKRALYITAVSYEQRFVKGNAEIGIGFQF